MHNSLASENQQNQVNSRFIQEKKEAQDQFNGISTSEESKNPKFPLSPELTAKNKYLQDHVFESHDHEAQGHLRTQSFNKQNNK